MNFKTFQKNVSAKFPALAFEFSKEEEAAFKAEYANGCVSYHSKGYWTMLTHDCVYYGRSLNDLSDSFNDFNIFS